MPEQVRRAFQVLKRDNVYRGNPVQNCRDSKNGSPTAVVNIAEAVGMSKRRELIAALPVVTQETSHQDLQKL